MKNKKACLVFQVMEDGSLADHENYNGREFVNREVVLQEIIDVEQRVASALGNRKVPDQEDLDFLEGLDGTEIVILETIGFQKSESENFETARELVEPRGGAVSDDRFAKMQKEIDRLKREAAAAKKVDK